MTRTVADDLWSTLVQAGVRRCYGIVGDALNPVIVALSRRPEIEFVSVRHEEWGVFAAVSEATLTGQPVAVCGTAGPGATHLLNGLLDAAREHAPIIAIAGDVETDLMDTDAHEEVNPYRLFDAASLYTARVVDAGQARSVFARAITTATAQRGPTVIGLPGNIAHLHSVDDEPSFRTPTLTTPTPSPDDLEQVARLVDGAERVMIFGGEGCRDAAPEVVALAEKLNAPVGYSFKGKVWLEADNANAVGMTGLLGYGGCHHAIRHADLILMLGTDFPYSDFLSDTKGVIVQVDDEAGRLGRRVPLALGVHADVGVFARDLTARVEAKTKRRYLDEALAISHDWHGRLQHYVKGGEHRSPIRPEYLAALLDRHADPDAVFSIDTGTPCIWAARHISYGNGRRLVGSLSWASMATASPKAFGAALAFKGRQVVALCGDGGFSMLALGDLITQVHHGARVVNVIVNNSALDFVNIEQQEAGLDPWGTDLENPNFADVATSLGATGIRVERPDELEAAVIRALGHRDGPVVLDVVVDKQSLALPSHVPGKTAVGFAESVAKRVLHGKARETIGEIEDNVQLL